MNTPSWYPHVFISVPFCWKLSCIEGSVRDGKEEFATIDMEKYKQYTFGMYSGEVKDVTMVFTNNMVNAVVDRFGRNIMIHKEDDYHFRVSVPVAVSPQFYGWVFGLGKMAKIVAPEDVQQGYSKSNEFLHRSSYVHLNLYFHSILPCLPLPLHSATIVSATSGG